jgi:hypothetical protein
MRNLELRRFKKAIGKITFGLFFPNENKRLEQRQGIGKQLDLVLVFVPEGKQTATVGYIRKLTGWTVKKVTAFVKEGDFPKVVIYNVKKNGAMIDTISDAFNEGVIFKIY